MDRADRYEAGLGNREHDYTDFDWFAKAEAYDPTGEDEEHVGQHGGARHFFDERKKSSFEAGVAGDHLCAVQEDRSGIDPALGRSQG